MKQKGFTMLFSVLVSSLLLSIGVAILDLTLKQFELSSAGRQSQFAFYAADDAQECALYWEYHDGNGGRNTSYATSSESIPNTAITCHGAAVTATRPGATPTVTGTALDLPETGEAITTYWISYGTGANAYLSPCAYVKVAKTTDEENLTSTIIESRGYDTCNVNNPRRTERGLQSIF
jgi:hypothetical protein